MMAILGTNLKGRGKLQRWYQVGAGTQIRISMAEVVWRVASVLISERLFKEPFIFQLPAASFFIAVFIPVDLKA